MLHKCRALRAVYVSMAQAVDMYYQTKAGKAHDFNKSWERRKVCWSAFMAGRSLTTTPVAVGEKPHNSLPCMRHGDKPCSCRPGIPRFQSWEVSNYRIHARNIAVPYPPCEIWHASPVPAALRLHCISQFSQKAESCGFCCI